MTWRCKHCHREHLPSTTCESARRRQEVVDRMAREAAVVHAPSPPSQYLPSEPPIRPIRELPATAAVAVGHQTTEGGSRHGKYKDTEKRKAYRRAWMKAKRATLKMST